MHTIKRFLNDRTAATAIEYGLIAGLIALVLVVSIAQIGSSTNGRFHAVVAAFN